MKNTWIALASTEGTDFSTNKGFVKLSVSVLGPNDEPVSLECDDNDAGDDNILMPPMINNKTFQLKFSIYNGAAIAPEVDMGSKIDP